MALQNLSRQITFCSYGRKFDWLLQSRICNLVSSATIRNRENDGTSANSPTQTPYLGSYEELHRKSLVNPQEFWAEIAQEIEWHRPYDQVLDSSKSPFTKWFVGGQLNTCHNALDRHIAQRGDQVALVHDSPVTGSSKRITYNELLHEVKHLAGALTKLGVSKGDHVMIYMPMIPEAVAAMLAIVRIGAIHSLVFGGFAARELATRISHLKPLVVISASCGIEPSRVVHYKPVLDQAIDMASHKPRHCVIFQRSQFDESPLIKGRDFAWQDIVASAPACDAVPVDSEHPCYVLYTSGTTGQPKGIVRPTGGHAVVLPWTLKAAYGINSGDVWWAASDFGWVVGHSFICYAPLMNGSTSVIYEGKPIGTPDAGQFFRVIQDHRVKGMFVAPTAIRAIMRDDFQLLHGNKYDTSSLKFLFMAGEPLDHETKDWALNAFKKPVLDNWWQTETGYPMTAHSMGLGMTSNPPRGSAGKAFMGYNIEVLNANGSLAEPGELGRIVCRLPLPPGCMSTLFEAPDRFIRDYFTKFPGCYDTMDAGMIDAEGYVSVMSREDDVINVAGHRLSTLALEEAILEHPDVIDVAVIGIPDATKGEVPLGLYILKDGCVKSEATVSEELIAVVRQFVGPVAAFRLSAQVNALPRTRSGKTARKSIADLARNKTITISPTIEDPKVYHEILKALRRCGVGLTATEPTVPN